MKKSIQSLNFTHPSEAIGCLLVMGKEIVKDEEVDQDFIDRTGCMRITHVLGVKDLLATADSVGGGMRDATADTLIFVRELIITRGHGLTTRCLRPHIERSPSGAKEILFSKKCVKALKEDGVLFLVDAPSVLRFEITGIKSEVTVKETDGRLSISYVVPEQVTEDDDINEAQWKSEPRLVPPPADELDEDGWTPDPVPTPPVGSIPSTEL